MLYFSYCFLISFVTVDRQVYNGTDIILAGHGSPIGTGFQGAIKTTDIKKLEIQFNHCVGYSDIDVIIEITDDKGKTILTKKFKINSGDRMTIEKKELGQLTTKLMTIRYREKSKNGTDQILGQIRLE